MNTRSITKDFSTWTRGTIPTAEHLLSLYESDFIVQFAIDGMTEDATNNWLKNFKEINADAPIAPKIITAMKWADLYGDSIAVLLNAATDEGQITDKSLLSKPFSGKAVGMDVFHPLVDGDGYDDPSPADLDALGNPKVFRVHIKGVQGIVDIDASRCVIFKGRSTRRSWRGIYVGIGSLDDTIDYRKWRAAYGARASKVAVPHAHWNKANPNAEWSATEKTKIDTVEGVDEAVVTTGEVTRETIGGTLTEGELDSTAIGLLNAIAVDLGVQLTDIFQNQSNRQDWAPDNNQSTYVIALISKQKRHEESVKKVLKAFGIKWEGWNSPWEEPLQQQIININGLANTYNTSTDPEIRSIVKSLLVTQYGEKTDYSKYLAAERASAERDANLLDNALKRGDGSSRQRGNDRGDDDRD